MAARLLEAKFRIPQLRRELIARPRLSARLTRGLEGPLLLVSAPAGFGKSTMLTEWLATLQGDGWATAWLALDPRDNDPLRFWTYVAAALTQAGDEQESVTVLPPEAAAIPLESLVSGLISDLDCLSRDAVLVLDDYHVIESAGVHDSVGFFLAHLPARMHLVLASRSDPGLPLAHLRARGQLTEVRSADLRFTPDEAAAYLNEAMGLALTSADVAALEGRTEGWIAALQLAALSLQGRDDTTAFIAGFAGDDRYIVDYLAEEVLQRQPEGVRQFLLQTSILDRLTGPLCDAVTGREDGKAMLAGLERSNLFLVPLDDRRQWYRYHHLFADVLRAHLMDEQAVSVPVLHRAASQWYADAGEPYEAIRHSIAAQDYDGAAALVELQIPTLLRSREDRLFHGWLSSLPSDVIRVRPVLSDAFAGVLLSDGGDLSQVERLLTDAERYVVVDISGQSSPTAPAAEMRVADEELFRRLPESVAVHRAGLSLLRGDLAGTITHARRALDLAAEDDDLAHAAAAALLGLAAWSSGDLVVAESAYADSMARMKAAHHIANLLGVSIAVADIQDAQGHLAQAAATYQRALRLADEVGGTPLRGTPDMHVGLSQTHYEEGDLAAAREELAIAGQLGEHLGLPQNPYRWRVALAQIRAAEGDLEDALDLLEQAARVFTSDFSPNVRPVPALVARLRIRMGHPREALEWAREQGLTVTDDLDYVREFEHITLARALLGQADSQGGLLQDATGLLERLLVSAETGGRTRSVIEILVLQALASQADGRAEAGVTSLQRAVGLAEQEGYTRVFLDEGPSLHPLLAQNARRDPDSAFVRRLMPGGEQASPTQPPSQGVIDPLSDRELDVLRLLATDLDGPAIARHLFISLNTVRTHTRSIYTKLDVTNRRAAVRRARDLNLV